MNLGDRKEVVVRGDGNCFYQAVSLWNDGTDKDHALVRCLVNFTQEKYPKDFERSFSKEQRDINVKTKGQANNPFWHKMRHLLVTGKKIHPIYTRQKTLLKKPSTDVSLTVKNFITEDAGLGKNTNFPVAIQYGIEKEVEAKHSYCKVMSKKHRLMKVEESGLLISEHVPWIGASPDGIRICACCEPSVVEIKCPFSGKDLHPRSAFLSANIGGVIRDDGKFGLKKNHLYYFQVQTEMAASGLKTCDFVTYTSLGLHIVEIEFDEIFWHDVVDKVSLFYTQRIIPEVLSNFADSLKFGNSNSAPPRQSFQQNTNKDDPLRDENEFEDIFLESDSEDSDNISVSSEDLVPNVQDKNILERLYKMISESKSDSDDFSCDHDDNINPEITLADLLSFAKQKDTVQALQKYIDEGCGIIEQFHPFRVTLPITSTLSRLREDFHDDIIAELLKMFPTLGDGFNCSKCVSVVHELLSLYTKQYSTEL